MQMQVGAADCRNSARTLANACKRLMEPNQELHIWVYEEAPEVLARDMLLLSILLDTEVPVRQRTELFLELHNNASIQATTAEYLGRLALQHAASSHRCYTTFVHVPPVSNGYDVIIWTTIDICL